MFTRTWFTRALPTPATIVTCLALLFAAAISPGVAAAEPTGSQLVFIDRAGQREQILHVYSESMDRVIMLQVITPFDRSEPRPTLYLLNGAGGGEDVANWHRQTDIVQFFADKNVNVVTPLGGAFSYYTDWQRDDPKLGRNKWTTFLTRELPPIIDEALGTSGVNAIGGISMAASSVLNLAIAAPDRYRAVASYSGCASTTDQLSRSYIKLVLERGDADPRNMWGEDDDPDWARNDAVLHADQLRGKTLYISSSSGLPGSEDTLANPLVGGQAGTLANQIVLGGVIEAATNLCTHRLADRLNELGIPADIEFRPTGTHSWRYWQDALHQSWPSIEAAIR
ncbi:alpha/beta hydrolase [Nocardia jejuensis]|uniref:alpha/beta hydrolase n=1 Tax=Nocardia jejuensis TaxID=328049 RepID=UPI00083211E7|nr:alpha/beta hydrolase family protein [Nocardia jejuensis]